MTMMKHKTAQPLKTGAVLGLLDEEERIHAAALMREAKANRWPARFYEMNGRIVLMVNHRHDYPIKDLRQ